MKLYWSPRSPFVRKVMVCAHEIGIADRIEKIYTLVTASELNPDVMRVNPLGRIPALVTDDGAVLYDSVVICEYLDAVHGDSRLFPPDKSRRWQALRRHALGDGMLETLILWRNERRRPAAQQSRGMLAAFEGKITSALDALTHEAPALAREPADIGHVAIACALGYIDFRFGDLDWRAGRADLAQWFASFSARRSMEETTPRDERHATRESRS